MRAAIAAAALVLGSPAGAAAAPALDTLASAQFLGGQYMFGSQKGSLGGNASVSVVPAVRIDEGIRLVPVIASSYQGTKQVLDLAGAGTLFQEQMDHRLGLRAVFGDEDGPWRIKPHAGFKYELLRETRDERWGHGLFDYRRLGGGLEVEYVYRRPYSVRAGVEDFFTSFPNYASLESQAPADLQGQPLARELAGRHVLDHHGQTAFAAATFPSGRFEAEGRLAVQHVRYAGQHLVDSTGALGREVRDDFLTALAWTLRMPADLNTDRRWLGGFSLGAAYNSSDQNSYDAARFKYLPRYYDYGEVSAGAQGTLLFGDRRRPADVSAGLSWSLRSYPHRPTQDETGLYGTGRQRQQALTFSASAHYPMADRWSLAVQFQTGRARSNQHYEQVYAYNYTEMSYLVGVSYEY